MKNLRLLLTLAALLAVTGCATTSRERKQDAAGAGWWLLGAIFAPEDDPAAEPTPATEPND